MTEPEVHAAALPNGLSVDELRLRPGADGSLAIDPARAGWRHLSFRVAHLAEGVGSLASSGTAVETALVVLGGGGLDVEADGRTLRLPGRADPFAGLPSAAYLPAGCRWRAAAVVGQPGGRVSVAVATAPPSGRSGVAADPIAILPADVAVETRGAGRSTRQINHIIPPAFPADRLLLVEVLTPAGNWSSWPPHKHDEDAMPGEAVLEEVYHYRFRRPEAWAVQRLYRRPERGLPPRDGAWAVRDGEVVLVTDGYHPFAATDADDAYYLNALAGDRRTMACSYDPDLDAVRERWLGESPDPRVPLVPPTAGG